MGGHNMYKLIWSKQAIKDWKQLERSEYVGKARELLCIIKDEPYKEPPRVKTLSGNLSGLYSRRINQQHRLVYEIDEQNKIAKIVSMWIHYHV